MLEDGSLRQDFRFRGFPNQSMHSPRQPITTSVNEDKRRNEDNFVKVFGKSPVFDPVTDQSRAMKPKSNMEDYSGNRAAHEAKPRIDNGNKGLLYGSDQIDNSPRAREKSDPLGAEKSSADMRRIHQHQQEAMDEIKRYKQEKLMQDFQREEEKRRGLGDNRRKKFTEYDTSQRENVVYTREPQRAPTYTKRHRGHDLFLDTLGGPGGTVVRKDGGPGLQSMPDPRLGAYRTLERGSDGLAAQEGKISEQQRRIDELKRELEVLKSPRADGYKPADTGYQPSFANSPASTRQVNFNVQSPMKEENRSLNLDNTRGGAGAPLKDDRGRNVTRFPVTMVRDDYGTTKIQEKIPGKVYSLPDEPVWDPFGRPGGGAPNIDRHGNRNTHVYGNFERMVGNGNSGSADQAKQVRAREVMLHDLRAGMEEADKKRRDEERRERAMAQDMAEVIKSKEVGRPKLDPITGTLANQHLGNSDVSKIKMNYQPKDNIEKKNYHDFLKEQVEENEKNKYLDKLRNRQESNKHFNNFDQSWGAFGGGAPKDRVIRKKVNLDNALYYYDRESRSEDTHRSRAAELREPLFNGAKPMNPSYQKRFLDEDIRHRSPDVTPRYVKNTTKSTSRNLYEYPGDKSLAGFQQSASPPYATG